MIGSAGSGCSAVAVATEAGARRGFALFLVLVVLLVISVVVAGGQLVAARGSRSAAAGPEGTAALYAAEAGLAAALSISDLTAVDSLVPGGDLSLATGRLANGAEYRVRLTRLDAGQRSNASAFLATSIGRSHGPAGGRRSVGLFLGRRRYDALCCEAALTAAGEIRVREGTRIVGEDELPADTPGRVGACPEGAGARPGILTDEPGRVQLSDRAAVLGEPPIAAAEEARDLAAEVARRIRELERWSDVRYEGEVRLHRLEPALRSDGSCDRSRPENWGAPSTPEHPCSDYYPVVYIAGDLTVDAYQAGQGVLIVEGDLALRGGIEFHGVVLVKGRLTSEGAGGRIYGGALVGNAAALPLDLAGETQLAHSACAVRRAVRGSKLHALHPLAQFAWLEILE